MLDSILINYDEAVVTVIDTADKVMQFCCKVHIGIQCIDHWDENVIEDIDIVKNSEVLEKALAKIKETYGTEYKSGGIRNYHKN